MPDRPPRAAHRWAVVIPVKPAALAKSRLGLGPVLARALALDTVAAVARASRVGRVVVVGGDAELAQGLALIGAPVTPELVAEKHPRGLSAAIRAGLAVIEPGVSADVTPPAPRAVLLGDLPCLLPGELDRALEAAALHERAFVPDADGTGTSLVTARAGAELVEAFGPGSAARHRSLGLAELPVPEGSGLRRDVDTPQQLREAALRGIGRRTAAALATPGGSAEVGA